MKEKTKSIKGEKYWYITSGCYVTYSVDFDEEMDKKRLECGNYFTTQEGAKEMAKKLRIVLNGADVIEMPSEEERDNHRPEIEIEGMEDRARGGLSAVNA